MLTESETLRALFLHQSGTTYGLSANRGRAISDFQKACDMKNNRKIIEIIGSATIK
ncbi:MAG: hypothetical protein HZB54_09925 [Deltaproteobacteria bacterium]|nr:hypothetical protein [Deltaproteobacteria bacterium]